MPQKQLVLQWHITEKCDRKCAHCYMYDSRTYRSESGSTNEMDFDLCQLAIHQFVELCKRLRSLTGIDFQPKFVISGGDPLLHADIFRILEEVKKHSNQIEILGNADRLNSETAATLYESGVRKFQISLDGMEKTHDQIRGKGSFRTAFNGLEILSRAGIETGIMFTLFRDNIKDICPLMEKVAEVGAHSFAFARVSSFGNAKDIDSGITPIEYRNLLESVYSLQKRLQNSNSRTCFRFKDHLWNLYLHEIGEYKIFPNIKDGKTIDGCHMAQSFMVLLSDGTVMACRRFYSPAGKFPEQSLSGIFLNSKNMVEYRKVKNLKKCSKCELLYYCRGCPAVAYGYHNDWKEADPQCWKEIENI